jgi:hypothetical protein
MPQTERNFSILFEELERSSDEHELILSHEKQNEEQQEYEEIRALSEIVREIENPPQHFFSTT